MIENIKLKTTNIFGEDIKTITFGDRNVIIGPKGGGKSTLFDLLANVVSGKILSTTIDALEGHQLQLHSVTIDGEKIPAASLVKENIKKAKKEEEIKNIYKQRNDVIYQDDDIKKNLDASSEFSKNKLNFAKELIETSEDINIFIEKIKSVHDSISKVILLDDVNINWFNAFTLKSTPKKTEEELLFKLNYSSEEIVYKATGDINNLKEEYKGYKKTINEIQSRINYFSIEKDTFISDNFSKQRIEKLKSLIKLYEEICKSNKIEIKRINMISKIVTSFSKGFNSIIIDIKKTSEKEKDADKKISAFTAQSEGHFINLAKRIKKASSSFDSFINNDVKLELNEEKDAGNLLKFKINKNIKFSEDNKYLFMKKVLYNAKKVQTSVAYWIESARNSGVKVFKSSLIKNDIAKTIQDEIVVTADGRDYETMSLGEKSIYGIRHKFNQSKGKPMFLDQPEDNLDNFTIAKDILSLINDKEEQLFIVTHNANIGILSKPNRVIIGAFEKDGYNQTLEQYLEGRIVHTEEQQSDSAHYLEGGIEYIKNRLQLIKGEK